MEARQLTDVADTATAGLDDVIEVGGLRQRYGGFEAVRDVSFTVARGEIFALLGTNGAGKTTTTEVLEGFRPASGGTVRVLGLDPEPAAPAMMAGESPLTARERDALALAAQGAQAGEITSPRERSATTCPPPSPSSAPPTGSRPSGSPRKKVGSEQNLFPSPGQAVL
ncbi:hypothetical protein GCM10027187_60920 [Streptosporangium sandarakinum]|uniref:ABC-type polysaccharide/polyol phosphate transport system ATPase subunit n=1 Tax=Streptosporangium sandarakinum TaxID=1260955 RepID=A0A852UWH4_9ACTN|nr:ABC-type polysaccharide/polyol phosphate transport system ATPase subunit [Streptosporangium sandarakinum]